VKGSVAAIVVETVAPSVIADVQVEEAVAIVIAPGYSLGEAVITDPGFIRDVDKRAITTVVIEPAAVARVGK
jgi:hypothetical protein